MNKLAAIFILVIVFSCNHPHYKNPHVIIHTGYGDIEVELYPAKAPKTVAAFLAYIDSGIYKNSSFYRVLKAEEMPTDFNTGIIQGGIYQSKSDKIGKIKPIPHESTLQTGLSHTNGIISFASVGAGTATTEFFICIGDQSALDAGRRGTSDGQGFAAFGKVFKGMDIVRKIQNLNSHGDRFDEKIEITNIERL
jgi:peptidyl-prolyl cis-trans isomerase A (cyclophilin A)